MKEKRRFETPCFSLKMALYEILAVSVNKLSHGIRRIRKVGNMSNPRGDIFSSVAPQRPLVALSCKVGFLSLLIMHPEHCKSLKK